MQYLGLTTTSLLAAAVHAQASYLATPWYQVLRQVLLGIALISAALCLGVRIQRGRARRRLHRAAEHPFRTLALQNRLTELVAEVQRLEHGDEWARGHHLRAAEAAYDHLLAEACARAGVANELADAARLRAAKPARLDMELALSERGWNW